MIDVCIAMIFTLGIGSPDLVEEATGDLEASCLALGTRTLAAAKGFVHGVCPPF